MATNGTAPTTTTGRRAKGKRGAPTKTAPAGDGLTDEQRSAQEWERKQAHGRQRALAALDGRHVPSPAMRAFVPRVRAMLTELSAMSIVASELLGPGMTQPAIERLREAEGDSPEARDECDRWMDQLARARAELMRLVAGPEAVAAEERKALTSLPDKLQSAFAAFIMRLGEPTIELAKDREPGGYLDDYVTTALDHEANDLLAQKGGVL
jgi:hypothetical protein